MKKWKYLKIAKEWFEGLENEELQNLGNMGWELCGISVEHINGVKQNVYYFKIEKM